MTEDITEKRNKEIKKGKCRDPGHDWENILIEKQYNGINGLI